MELPPSLVRQAGASDEDIANVLGGFNWADFTPSEYIEAACWYADDPAAALRTIAVLASDPVCAAELVAEGVVHTIAANVPKEARALAETNLNRLLVVEVSTLITTRDAICALAALAQQPLRAWQSGQACLALSAALEGLVHASRAARLPHASENDALRAVLYGIAAASANAIAALACWARQSDIERALTRVGYRNRRFDVLRRALGSLNANAEAPIELDLRVPMCWNDVTGNMRGEGGGGRIRSALLAVSSCRRNLALRSAALRVALAEWPSVPLRGAPLPADPVEALPLSV